MTINYSNQAIKTNFNSIVSEKLTSLGFFKDQEQVIYYKDFGNNKYASIHFDIHMNRTGTHLVVNPIMGFLHGHIEKTWKDLMPEYNLGLGLAGYNSITVQNNIGYYLNKKKYLNWKFSKSISNTAFRIKIFLLFGSVHRVTRKLEKLRNDKLLLSKMMSNEIGLTISNRLKVPLLLWSMNRNKDAFNMAIQTLNSLRPNPKNPASIEPDIFEKSEDAWEFFKRDKDPIEYYTYKKFYQRFSEKLG